MELKIFNNLSRSKEVFKPITQGKVKFYSCGPTTYNYLHVGNARALVVADLFHRALKVLGYDVTFVRNYTDVDDKIIDRAKELNENAIEFAARWVSVCEEDMNNLGMMPATHTPKVSETMPEIIKMIEDIIQNGFGYVVDGEVFFEVPKFKNYGELSKKDLDSLQHGIRVEVDSKKRNPADFVLWKPAKTGEVFWPSPWGNGRPGWHIECSAMAKKFLGPKLDLHHGGVDLMFPHHENEIAQSEAANNCKFCNNWAHNEFLNFGSEKMSKSLGNVVTIADFNKKFTGQVLRQILLSVHYRARIEWSDEVIERGISDVDRIHEFLVEFNNLKTSDIDNDPKLLNACHEADQNIKKELCNDFNSAGAFGEFFSFIRFCRREIFINPVGKKLYSEMQKVIKTVNLGLGAFDKDPQKLLNTLRELKKADSNVTISEEEILKLIEERKVAKSSKNWARADEIRNTLKSLKIVLKDSPDGSTSWSIEGQ